MQCRMWASACDEILRIGPGEGRGGDGCRGRGSLYGCMHTCRSGGQYVYVVQIVLVG